MHRAPVLTVSLAALTANYRLLAQRFTGGQCAAVVKANAYGLGVERVAQALSAAGCELFFVATLEEGMQLRGALPQAAIGVFHGPYAGEEPEYAAHRLTPVLGSPEQLARWQGMDAPYMLHVDTGMHRLGLSQAELEAFFAARPVPPSLLISHLACANERAHPLNAQQLARFARARAVLPQVPGSLCNSSGIFLPPAFHHQVARPGCSLYGIQPADDDAPMQPVVTLRAPILQIRRFTQAESVGYGATFTAPAGARIAIVQLGYADGYFRQLSNRGEAQIAGYRVPVAGRVSMDMVMLDVTAVPEHTLGAAASAEFLNADITVDAVAAAAGTIGYEVLTRLGRRVRREYVE